jgi:hypothetical protein
MATECRGSALSVELKTGLAIDLPKEMALHLIYDSYARCMRNDDFSCKTLQGLNAKRRNSALVSASLSKLCLGQGLA